jgi:excisionase family DNA binding protein
MIENPFQFLFDKMEKIESKVDVVVSARLNADGLNKDEFLSVEQTAEYLGVKTSTIYSYTRSRKLRHYKRGSMIYFRRSDINAYIEQGLVEGKSAFQKYIQ